MNTCYEELLLKSATNQYTLTVVTNPASATCTLTYGGQSYSSKSATVDSGTVISYSIYHSTYGTTTGTITMNSHKTLTCEGTYSTSQTYSSWSRPNLSANGTLGGDSFAVSAPDYYSNFYPYYACDSVDNYQHAWCSRNITANSSGFTFYNPNPLKISALTINHMTGTTYTYRGYQGKVYGSDTNGNWTELAGWSVSDTAAAANVISLNLNTNNAYKYYKIIPTALHTSNYWSIQELYITAQQLVDSYTYYWDKTVTNVKTDTYPWEQPILSVNGTMGESSFAVVASSESSASYAAWKAFDDNSSNTQWRPSSGTTTQTYTFYNPVAINVTKLEYEFTTTTYTTTIDLIEGSNDNTNWTTISKADTTDSAIVTSALTNSAFYKYYRTTFAAKSSGSYRLKNLSITAVEHI